MWAATKRSQAASEQSVWGRAREQERTESRKGDADDSVQMLILLNEKLSGNYSQFKNKVL